MKTLSRFLLSSVLITFSVVFPAHAGLMGTDMVATWSFPPSYSDINSFTVGSGLELDGGWGLGHSLDVRDDRIVVGMSRSIGLASGVKWTFSDIDFALSNVRVNTNYQGWQDSFLNFGSDFININFLNDVRFDSASAYFEMLVSGPNSDNPAEVSEPSALGLMLLALALLLRPMHFKRARQFAV